MAKRIWETKSGGVIKAAKIKDISIAYLLFSDSILEFIIPIFDKKKAIIGAWNNKPIQKTLHKIKDIKELIEKIISSFPANEIKKLRLIGNKIE